MLPRAATVVPPELDVAIIRDPLVLSPDTTIMAAIDQMNRVSESPDQVQSPLDLSRAARSSCVLVAENDRLLGILTERDVVRLAGQSQWWDRMTLRQAMTQPPVTLHESALTDIWVVLDLLQRYQIRHLPILNAQNGLVGLLTETSLQQAIRLIPQIRDRHSTDAALQTSEAHHRALMCAIPDLIMRINRAGIYLEFVATPNFHVVGNLPEMVGTHVVETLPPNVAQKRMHFIQRALETKAVQIYEQDLSIDGITQIEEVRVVPYGKDEVLALVRDISDRKQAELALQASEAKSRAILAAIPDLMFRVGADGVYREFVTQHRELDLIPQDIDPVGRSMRDILPMSIADRQLHYLQKALQTGELQVYEQRVKANDRCRDEEVRVVKSGEDEVLFMIRDISERKQAAAALQRLVESTAAVTGRDFFAALAQQLTLALQVKYVLVTKLVDDSLQTLAYWKDGQPQAELKFALADAPCCKTAIEQGEFYCPHGLQEQFVTYPLIQSLQADSYLGIPLTSIHGQRLGNLCILDSKPMEDVKWAEVFLRIFAMRAAAELERQQATEALEHLNQELEMRVEQRTAALRNSETELSAIFNQAAVGINLATLDGRYFKVNQKLCDILGYSEAELLTKRFQEISHPDDIYKADEERQRLYDGLIDSFTVEKRCLHKNGRIVWINLTVSVVRAPSGEPEYSIGVLEDINDRKQFEEQLQQTNEQLARATRLKDEFLANMSHELRTPLNAILGMTEGLKDQGLGLMNERQLKALQTIERSGSHLLELINDVLDVAKVESGQMKLDCTPTAITPLCEASLAFVRQLARNKQIQLTTQISPNLPDLLVDERRIRQVLINLLNNAVKFTLPGGQITLVVSHQPQPTHLDPERCLSQPYLQISVIDTGIGIAAEHLSQLFQPFVQVDSALNRKYEGTGLGLSLVKSIVELHGGQVSVTSQVGIGSCFTVELPCVLRDTTS